MSEEKLYMVKNDDGEYWDFNYADFWRLETAGCYETTINEKAELVADEYGGHVVTLVGASKPEVVSEEEAKMLATLMDGDLMPVCELSYFVRHAEQLPEKESIEREDRLMRAYVNGYTVAKEKKYNVKVPHAEGWYFQKYSSESRRGFYNDWKPFPAKDVDSNMSKYLFLFTEAEIEHYGLQDCEKMEVKD